MFWIEANVKPSILLPNCVTIPLRSLPTLPKLKTIVPDVSRWFTVVVLFKTARMEVMKANFQLIGMLLLCVCSFLLLQASTPREKLDAEQLRYLKNQASNAALRSEQLMTLPYEGLHAASEGYAQNLESMRVRLRVLTEEIDTLSARVFESSSVPREIQKKIDALHQQHQELAKDSGWAFTPWSSPERVWQDPDVLESKRKETQALFELCEQSKEFLLSIRGLDKEIRAHLPPRR